MHEWLYPSPTLDNYLTTPDSHRSSKTGKSIMQQRLAAPLAGRVWESI